MSLGPSEFRAQVFAPNRALVQRHFALLGYCRADVDDATSEVFIEAWRSLDRYDAGQGSVATWVRGIARNVARDRRKRRRRYKNMLLEFFNPTTRDADDGGHPCYADAESGAPSPELSAELREVFVALDALTAAEREVVVAHLLMGATFDELEAETGVDRSKLHRMVARFREKLRGGAGHDPR